MNRDLEFFAAVVHSFTAFGHALGLIHAIRKKLPAQIAIHAGALAFDTWAVFEHAKDAKEPTVSA